MREQLPTAPPPFPPESSCDGHPIAARWTSIITGPQPLPPCSQRALCYAGHRARPCAPHPGLPSTRRGVVPAPARLPGRQADVVWGVRPCCLLERQQGLGGLRHSLQVVKVQACIEALSASSACHLLRRRNLPHHRTCAFALPACSPSACRGGVLQRAGGSVRP